MDFGISLPPELSLSDQISYINKIQSIGFDSVWLGDNPPENNAFANISSLLPQTETIEFWTGVTSPFYYLDKTLVGLVNFLHETFPNRFGLGISIGNPSVTKNDELVQRPFTNFVQYYETFIESLNAFDIHTPIAIGALGNRMCKYALSHADILSLNSGSVHDIKRAVKIKSLLPECNTKIIPYTMMEILDNENDQPSVYLWNMVKGISKTCSTQILLDHGIEESTIKKLHSLSWEFDKSLPSKGLLDLIEDFALLGTVEEICDTIRDLKTYIYRGQIHGLVLGWIYKKQQWNSVKKIGDMLLQLSEYGDQ